MAIRNIRYESDEILRKKSKVVDIENNKTKILQLVNDMFETLQVNNGLGLAAVQVGVLKRIIVIEYELERYVLINPEIIFKEGKQICEEGCLSFPELFYEVERPEHIKIKYINEDFKTVELETHGLLSVIISHELDHLDGILFVDKRIEK